MIRHVIVWKLKDEIEDKATRATEIKTALESLNGRIDGLKKMSILTEKLASSSGDIMMDSEFESREALEAYQKNPLHVEIANGIVRPSVELRLSFDYEA